MTIPDETQPVVPEPVFRGISDASVTRLDSFESSEVVGEGRSATVYAFEKGTVLKLFKPEWPGREVRYELALAEWAYGHDLPTPKPLSLVRIKDRVGIVFERMYGPTLSNYLTKRPWEYRSRIACFARLHQEIHARPAHNLRSQADYLSPMITRSGMGSEQERASWVRTVEQHPEVALTHNDFHPGNTIVTDKGLVVVDWSKGSHGHPTLDVAITVKKLGGLAQLPGFLQARRVKGVFSTLLVKAYLDNYLERESDERVRVEALAPVVEAALARPEQ